MLHTYIYKYIHIYKYTHLLALRNNCHSEIIFSVITINQEYSHSQAEQKRQKTGLQ